MGGSGAGADGRSSCFGGFFASRLVIQLNVGLRTPRSGRDSLIWSPRHQRLFDPCPCAGETSMRWTGPFLIVLTLLSLGCARGDWTTETLTLVDVTGTWEGSFRTVAGTERTTRWVLQQKGAKVRGEVQGPDGAPVGSVEGLVNGEVFSWQLNGHLMRLTWGNPPSRSYRGEATVNSDEFSGRADGLACPCTFILRRVSAEAIKDKK